jgi:hypothetical protein
MSPGRWFVTLRVEATADPPTIEGMPMTAGWPAASVVADDGWCARAYDGRGFDTGRTDRRRYARVGAPCGMA